MRRASQLVREQLDRDVLEVRDEVLGCAAAPLRRGKDRVRRIGQPEDVAAAALFLASDVSSWITGITLDIAGGKIMV